MTVFKTIGLVARDSSVQVLESLSRVARFLDSRSVDVVLEEASAVLLPDTGRVVATMAGLGETCDLLIAVGGDGNILNAGRAMARYGVPILGINRGRLGFLADISPDEIEARLGEVLAGEYTVEEHFLLEGEVQDSEEAPCALNEVVLHSNNMPKMLEIDLYVDDVFVYNQHSDGLIISSPTGSTAYALSAGGPIMHPSLDAIVLVPMFPHALTSRPLVVPGGSEIRLVIGTDTSVKAKVSFDSHLEFQVEPGDSLIIRKKKEKLTLIHPPGHSFYGTCRSKLNWASRLIR